MVSGLDGVDWPRQRIEGHGHFTATATDLAFDVVLRAGTAGTGAERTARLTVESVTAVSQPVFHLDEKSLTIEGATIDPYTLDGWKKAATDAFNSAPAGQAITGKLVDALTDDSLRDRLSAAVTDQLAKALDGVLGAVPPGALPTDDRGFPAKYGPLEVYLFDRLRACVNDTASGFYPPTVVLGATDPVLEPYRVGRIDLGSYRIGVAQAQLTFYDVTVNGISNVLIPVEDARLTEEGIAATLRLGRLPGDGKVPLPPLTVTGTGVIAFPDTADGARDDDDTITGAITVTVEGPSATAGVSFTGRDADELTIGLDSLTLTIAPPDLKVTIRLEESSPWEKAINQVLNKDEVKRRIVEGTQQTADAHRADIAKELTTNARTVVRAKLGG
ncbi:hypothetical protein [Streptantibioticus cattleyicolor]|uniref:Uncharacterized protein n=1 Tax=Streptantibioticus cattleyicolor (strain ATCC 35852 / DSM 46488 / JCM 4925 / NBRC 14057 / NRRL 8057) TaxID=1003195 RepID=F8JL20_STREN|nr:hypothetical protein [Streptantibioticus cattleyicolor]AEW98401.1 hypothetical protein SCATT_p02080 [Streptantibioticus cattleyicolor NRRL 8057 = DSM 46488]CCB72540.1 protein of unknown function [Streptantibioticus cattleyicolor NRRL 8057 = DSM 46488]